MNYNKSASFGGKTLPFQTQTFNNLTSIKNLQKLKNSKSFAAKVSKGLGLNLRSFDDLNDIDTASNNLLQTLQINIDKNPLTKHTIEDEQLANLVQGTQLKASYTASAQKLHLLSQSFLTNMS